MRQLVNLAYAALSEGRDRAGMLQLDAMLAPPAEKEAARDKANAEAMKGRAGFGVGPPPRKPGS